MAISCPNLPFFPIVYYGILKAGASVVPLNVLLKGREVAYHLADSEAKAYFCFQGTPELAIGEEGHAGFEQTDGCEHFFMITVDPAAASPIEGTETLGQAHGRAAADLRDASRSATTTPPSSSTPPAPPASPRAPSCATATCSPTRSPARTSSAPTPSNPDTYLCVLPLFHSFGQTVIMNGGFAYGGTVVMLPRFEADPALKTMVKEKVTFFAGVPTMYWGLLGALADSGVDVAEIKANLRVAAAGGSALPVEVHKEFEKKFGVTILEGYGLSETSPVASFSPYGDEVRVARSACRSREWR